MAAADHSRSLAWVRILVAIIGLIGVVFATVYGKTLFHQIIQISVTPPSDSKASNVEEQLNVARKRAEEAERALQAERESFKHQLDRLEGDLRQLKQRPEVTKEVLRESSPVSPALPRNVPLGAKAEAEGFTFQANECRPAQGRSGFGCAVTITNNGELRQLSVLTGGVVGGSTFIDNLGTEHPVKSASGGGSESQSFLHLRMIPNVPVRVGLLVGDLNPQATRVTVVVSISLQNMGTPKPVVLRDIAIIK